MKEHTLNNNIRVKNFHSQPKRDTKLKMNFWAIAL